MKKTFILISMMALSTVSMAQKGSIYTGGVVGFNSQTYKPPSTSNDDKEVTTSWAVGPEFGGFVTDKIQVGIALGVSGTTQKSDDDYEQTNISPTLYVRNFFKIADNFNSFLGLYLGVLTGKYSEANIFGPGDFEQKFTGFGARVGMGVAYNLSPRFTAVGQYGLLGFQTVKYKTNGDDDGSLTGFDFGVNTVGSAMLPQGNGSGAVFNIGLYYTISSPESAK